MTVLSRLFVPTQSKRLNELIGILLIATAVLMLLAMASYSPLDRSLNTAANPPIGRPAHNWIGLVGAYSADLMLQAMGVMAFLLPVMLLFLALRWMRSRTVENPVLKAVAALSLVAFASALLALLPWPAALGARNSHRRTAGPTAGRSAGALPELCRSLHRRPHRDCHGACTWQRRFP